jgi:hypothetical protein
MTEQLPNRNSGGESVLMRAPVGAGYTILSGLKIR